MKNKLGLAILGMLVVTTYFTPIVTHADEQVDESNVNTWIGRLDEFSRSFFDVQHSDRGIRSLLVTLKHLRQFGKQAHDSGKILIGYLNIFLTR